MKFAGFWIRAGAGIIDLIILMGGFFLLEKITGIAFFQALNEDFRGPVEQPVLVAITYFLWFLYFVLFVSSKWQATPGKRVFKIYIATKDGASKVSLLRSIGRELGTYLSLILLGIGYIMIGFTREKTALHDIMAGTRVVYGKA